VVGGKQLGDSGSRASTTGANGESEICGGGWGCECHIPGSGCGWEGLESRVGLTDDGSIIRGSLRVLVGIEVMALGDCRQEGVWDVAVDCIAWCLWFLGRLGEQMALQVQCHGCIK